MNLNEYQSKALETAIYPNIGNNIEYPTLGLCGEAGEIANKVKKIQRDKPKNIKIKKYEIALELGDVMWYVAVLAKELGYDLEDICGQNVEKLADRKKRNTLSGTGDER